jgi:hypothetical protein
MEIRTKSSFPPVNKSVHGMLELVFGWRLP